MCHIRKVRYATLIQQLFVTKLSSTYIASYATHSRTYTTHSRTYAMYAKLNNKV